MTFPIKFSAFELRDMLIAWLCLAVAFTLALSGGLNLIKEFEKVSPDVFALTFIIAVVTVGLSFVLHEGIHKIAALRYGYWAEFRKSTQMLLIAVVVAVVTGIVFAAPGKTLVNTGGRQMSRREEGVITASGPLTNLILAVPFFAIMAVGILSGGVTAGVFTTAGFLYFLGLVGFQVNAMIAFFNMLPVAPLDGKKVLAWSPVVFVVLIAVSLLVLYVSLTPQLVADLLL